MWYSLMGVLQFTVWEALYVHCCATKRIPFMSDQEAAASPWNFLVFCLAGAWGWGWARDLAGGRGGVLARLALTLLSSQY